MTGQRYVEQLIAGSGGGRSYPSVGEGTRHIREAGWGVAVKMLERFSGYRRGLGSRDFHIAADVRDLVVRKSRETRGDVEVLVGAVMRAGSYTREEASHAVRAVTAVLQERVPPDLLTRVADYLRFEERADEPEDPT